MPWYVLGVFVSLTLVAQYHVVQALRHLEKRPDNSLSQVWALGILARRERFTAEGWRHRTWALVLQFGALLAAMALWLASGTLTR